MKALLPLLFAIAGCATVEPWQRGDLARPSMASPFADGRLDAAQRDKVVQTTTSASLPGSAPGGGCGCTQ